ncbi:hypothetical protein [Nonomuraea typhae]|uniref:hypothetical protein n=1 Tax=Nonomuraea typhae TaxID=2603600 RepID=UPI0012FC46A1|nr:hypothetical protein [Nonomuraea typhae]
MSSFAFTDATTYVAGYDFTTDLNQITLKVDVEEKDCTTFGGGGFRSRLAGLRNIEAELQGYWQSATSGAVDPESFPDLGVVDRPVTMTPTGAAGSAAYIFQAGKFSYQMFGQVGEVTPFTLSCLGTNGVGVARGQVAAAKGAVSATGALGSVLNLGAPTSTQYVYAVLHVFSAGTTITVQVQSDDSAGMGSPTTRGTIGPITTTGGTWMTRVAGPFVGETHWRMNVSAITGTFSVAGAIAVQ